VSGAGAASRAGKRGAADKHRSELDQLKDYLNKKVDLSQRDRPLF